MAERAGAVLFSKQGQPTSTRRRPAPTTDPARLVLDGLYRLLPGIAMTIAGMAILVTIGQVLTSLSRPAHPAPAVPTPAGEVSTAARPIFAETPAVVESPTVQPTAIMAPVLAPPLTVPTSALFQSPAATATPMPPATFEIASAGPRSITAQGRVLQRNDQVDLWFLIKEPGRDGLFRQGPAIIDPDGSYVFLLSLLPLDSGPDSVTLAMIPKDLSATWLRQALSTGAWLPVVPIRPENGITFVREIRL